MHRRNRLQELRVAAGMSQGRVAEALGVDRSTVSRMESRDIPITDDHKDALAALLGVTVPHLMYWDATAAA